MKKITILLAFLVTCSWQLTAQVGSTFTNSVSVSSLPYVATGETTCGFGDNYSTADIACTGSYLDGDEKIYSFTPSSSIADFNVELTNIGTSWSGIYITDDSTTSGTCVGDVGSSSTATKGVYGVSLVAGTTYYILVSTYASPQCITAYDINMYSVSCPAPNTLSANAITSSGATISWTEVGSATSWEFEFDTAGYTQGSVTSAVVSSATNVLFGLSADTDYEFYVRSGCGANDSSLWSGPYSFSTLCNTFTSPFLETFDTYLPTSCWNQAGSGAPSAGPGGLGSSNWSQSGFPGAGTGATRVNLYSNSKEEWILSPLFDLSAGGPYEVRVENLFTDYSSTTTFSGMGSDDTVQVLISTNGGTSWSPIYTWDAANPGMVAANWINVDLTSYTSATIQFAIWASEGAISDSEDYYAYIGGFELRDIPSCAQPDTLMASNITTSGADLYWSEMGTATLWDLEIVAAGTTPSGTPTNSGVTSDSVTINTLSSSTSYDYYVRADCGGATSPWTGPFTFTTVCAAVSSFSENFDGVTAPAMPNCWGNLYYLTNTFGNVQTNNSTTNANSGNNSVRFYNSSDLNPTWMLVSPELSNLSAGTHQTVFYAKDTDANDIIIGTMSDPMDTATFTAFDTITTTSTYAEYIVSFAGYSGSDDYIAYRSVPGATYDYTYMDDISWEMIPTCPKPSLLTVSNVNDVSAILGWSENGSATAWEIEWDTTGFTPGMGTVASVATNPFTLNGLTANTSYEYYLRSVCGSGDSSLWVGPMSFTTTPDTINSFPYSNDIEAGLGMYLGLRTNTESDAFVDAGAASTGAFGIHLTGNSANDFAGGSTSATETQAFVTNASHVSAIDMIVDATSLTSLSLKFDMKQTYSYGPNYSWGRVTVNGTQLGASVNPSTAAADPFITVNVDLTAYVGTVITLSIEHSGKYNTANGSGGNGDNAYIDNIELYQAVLASAVVDSDVTCFGGSDGGATVSAMNGTPTYNFLWSNGATTASISGVAAGTYTVTVTDAVGDSSFASVDIMDGAALALDLGNDTSLCLNAALTLDAGTFTSYLWDDGSTMQTRSTVNTAVGTTSYSVTVTAANSCTAVDTLDVMIMADPVVALGNDTSICDGSMLTLDAGSFATYLWDDATTAQTRMVSSVLGATTYSVTATNVAGCSGSDAIVVTGYAPVMVSLGNDTSVCDAVTLSLDAGTYTSYVWDDASTTQTRTTVSTVGAVDYSVEVTDANGCTGNDTISVTGFAMTMVDLGNDTTVCDAVTLTLDAGTFASYVWDDASTMQTRTTVSTVGAVDYSVEVTDANGCTANDTIEVAGSAPVVVNLGADASICNEATLTLDAGSFASYVWDDASTMQTRDVMGSMTGATTYYVAVMNAAGCAGGDSIVITGRPEVVVDLGPDTNIWQAGVTEITLDAGAGFTSYLWSDNITATQTYVVRQSNSGSVYVVVEDANGCTGTDTTVVKFVLGVDEFDASSLKMYPNPAVDQVTVELNNFGSVNNVDVTFMTITGQVVMSRKINVSGDSHTETFDVTSLATGSYLVKFDANGETVIRQFVIK